MIGKVFTILEAMAGNREDTSIYSLSKRTGIPKSTVHRILSTLAEEEIVALLPGKGYVMTPKLISIGLKGLGQKELLDIAIPIMRAVSEITRETVSMNVICGIERVCVYKVDGEQPITRNIKIGDRGLLFIGSAGKVIAAGLSGPELAAVTQKYIANGTLVEEQVPALLREVAEVKEKGFAVSIEERLPGCASVAVPILDMSGQTLASLSISSVVKRMSQSDIEGYVEALCPAAAQISFQMGGS